MTDMVVSLSMVAPQDTESLSRERTRNFKLKRRPGMRPKLESRRKGLGLLPAGSFTVSARVAT